MALFSKLPSPPGPSYGSLFNKRMCRNVVLATCSFFFVAILLIWSRGGPYYRKSDHLPPLRKWPDVTKAHDFPTTSQFQPVAMDTYNKTTEELCASFPSHILETIQPILKTGFTENSDRFNSQMDSVSACFKPGELLIFSDMEGSVRGHEIFDVVGALPDTYRDNEHYQLYVDMHEMKKNGTFDRDPETLKKVEGWVIDKFKFLPGVEQAWLMKPNKDFYVFYESDTYVFWDNMFRHLQSLDPDVPIYFGSPSPGRFSGQRNQGTLFANGGPGYVLSRAAVKKILHRRSGATGHYIDPPFTEKWRYLLDKAECCGDSALGWVVFENEIMLQGYYPMLSPYTAKNVPYDNKHWCEPVLTLHKPDPNEMLPLFKFEFSHRKLGSPLMFSDLWHFYEPGSIDIRNDWDNKGENGDRAPESINSLEACQQHCRDNADCMQFTWLGQDAKECFTLKFLRQGRERTPETHDDDKNVDFTAGWLVDRVKAWRESDNCEAPHWPGPSLSRIF